MSADKWEALGFVSFELFKGNIVYVHYTAIASVLPYSDYSSIFLKNGQRHDVNAAGYQVCNKLYEIATKGITE